MSGAAAQSGTGWRGAWKEEVGSARPGPSHVEDVNTDMGRPGQILELIEIVDYVLPPQ